MVMLMEVKCEIGDIVQVVWVDVGVNHEYYPIEKIEDLICEFREDFEVVTFGEVLYLKDNEIALAYSRNNENARVIYLRIELIKSLEVLEPRKVL